MIKRCKKLKIVLNHEKNNPQQAFDELNDATVYYEEQQAGLGLRLKDEVDQHVNWILGNSSLFHRFVVVVTVVLISKYFHTILPTLFVKIPYGFLLLHMPIVNLNTGLKEKSKSANNSMNKDAKKARLYCTTEAIRLC